jgi:hypothetical protein
MSDFNVDFDQLSKRKIENGDIIPMGSDSEFAAEFTIEKVPNFDGTDYVEVPHLRLQAPGNTKAVYHQPVRMESYPGRPSDPERFPREWAAFQAGQSTENGTSIYAWEGMSPADARRFELAGIKTVEQLANVSDMNLSGLGVGAMALRERARSSSRATASRRSFASNWASRPRKSTSSPTSSTSSSRSSRTGQGP